MTGLPRLTRFMRAPKKKMEPAKSDAEAGPQKRLIPNRDISLLEVKTFLLRRNYRKNWGALNKFLTNLQSLIVEEINSANTTEPKDHETIFILCLFFNAKELTEGLVDVFKESIGPTDEVIIAQLYSIAYEICTLLNEDCHKYLLEIAANVFNINSTEKWGTEVECVLPMENTNEEVNLLQSLTPNMAAFSKTAQTFDMKYEKAAEEEKSQNNCKKCSKMYTKSWLEKRVKSEHLYDLMQLLKTEKSDEELQSDMCELLSFEKIEVIEEIIKGRKQIVTKCEQEILNDILKAKLKECLEKTGPCLNSITVYTEQEKKLLKQLRKERKRNKSVRTNEESSDDEYGGYSYAHGNGLGCPHQEEMLKMA